MKRQRGIALVTAIFVVTLASIAAVAMFEAANISVHRSANLVQSEAEWWYASGVESWVKGILLQDKKLNPNGPVGLNGIWAKPVDFLPIDGGGIRGHIEDLQGRFNLNNIGVGPLNPSPTGPPIGAQLYIDQLDRLLDSLPNFDASKYHGLGYAIRDWIDADDQRSGTDGAEDQDYLSLDPPYRAANQPMSSVSELMLVRGMTKELYVALLPYVAALPTATATPPGATGTFTAINVNTAPEPVLRSLAINIDKSALEKFIAIRKTAPLTDKAGVTNLPFLPPPVVGAAQQIQLDFKSQYFQLQAEVSIGSGRLALYSVILRPGSGAPVILAHSTNTE